ncbi:phage portal protein [Pseudomonas viridiflava]|uniref:phage portal protein n=1 Tax=Pseudomonas viridiflava TaxID=33069 RepID=UPI000F02938B|nr:phage portal protein [Pseudomonas viridiflava]
MGFFSALLGLRVRPAAVAPRAEPALGLDVAASPGRQRSFQMARHGRLTSSWTGRTAYGDANQQIYADHVALTARAREQSINNGYAKRFYRLLKQNIVGSKGVQLMSKAVLADGKPDRATRRLIELEFWKWCKRGNCDVTRKLSFWMFQRLWVETLARDGEVMVRIVRNFPNRWGFALQILEVDRLDITLNSELSNGNRVRMGVEFDAWEAPVAYWLLKAHPGDVWQGRAEEKYDRIPVGELRHSFDPWRPHQARGFTWTHASALELHHLGEYRNSEMVAAEQGAKITGVYEQDAEFVEDPGADLDDGELDEVVEAGSNKLLPYGVKWKPYTNTHPSSNFAPFTKAGLRGVAAGFGPSYNKLAHDLEGVSFSSMRSGELDDRDFYKDGQQLLIDELLELVGETWLDMALLKGVLKLPPRNFHLYGDLEWAPRGWDWVDPTKDSKAATESIANRTKTRGDYIRQTGRDPDEVFAEMAEEEARLRELGLSFNAPPTVAQAQPQTDKKDDDKDEAAD